MAVESYGVLEQSVPSGEYSSVAEEIRLNGFAVLQEAFTESEMSLHLDRFEKCHALQQQKYPGGMLEEIDEHNTIRCPLYWDGGFLDVARHPAVLAIAQELIGGKIILNQQNGIINPPSGQTYNQAAWHRDLPYQHFVSTRPLAINALLALDDFTVNNGATKVIPGSHRHEAFPSDEFVERNAKPVEVRKGSYLILDCMVWHRGGLNQTEMPRRAMNNVYTIPLIRQQISLPDLLGEDWCSEKSGLRSFLGYGFEASKNIDDWYQSRRSRTVRNGGDC